MIELILLVALGAAFFILLAGKVGVIEYVQLHGNAFFAAMFRCNFCLSWWTAVVICIIVSILTGDARVLTVPLFATPITRMLV